MRYSLIINVPGELKRCEDCPLATQVIWDDFGVQESEMRCIIYNEQIALFGRLSDCPLEEIKE